MALEDHHNAAHWADDFADEANQKDEEDMGNNGNGNGQRAQAPTMVLPTQTTKISTTLNSRIQLWLGGPKIGKTVQASRIPGGALFLAFEPGHDHVECFKLAIGSWMEMLGACAQLAKAQKTGADLPYHTVVIDTASEAFERCREHVLNENGIQHETDLSYGKGSALVRDEFRRVITKLCNLGFGVVMIAHVDTFTKKVKRGKEYVEHQQDRARLSKSASEIIPPMADLILFFAKEWNDQAQKWERVIYTQGSDAFQAGVRYPPNWTVGLPARLPMSYKALAEAWEVGEASARNGGSKPAPKQARQDDAQDDGMEWGDDDSAQDDQQQAPQQEAQQPKPKAPRQRKAGTKLK